MDARVVDELLDAVVSGAVLLAQEGAQLDEQLAAQHLVAVHVANVLELRLHCEGTHTKHLGRMNVSVLAEAITSCEWCRLHQSAFPRRENNKTMTRRTTSKIEMRIHLEFSDEEFDKVLYKTCNVDRYLSVGSPSLFLTTKHVTESDIALSEEC